MYVVKAAKTMFVKKFVRLMLMKLTAGIASLRLRCSTKLQYHKIMKKKKNRAEEFGRRWVKKCEQIFRLHV